jgi:exonuclease VII large subunit
MSAAVAEFINEKNKSIETLRYKLSKYDYKNIFNKGFVFIKDENSNIINSVDKVNFTDKYYVQFIDGIKTVVFIEDKE